MDGAVTGVDRKFYLGGHRGKTYQWVLDNRPDYIQWARQQVNPSQSLTHFVSWVEQNFIVEGDSVVLRAAVNQPPGEYQPRPRGRAAPREPPHPPLPERCADGCFEYSYAGSTAYTVRMTCRACNHSTTAGPARRNENFAHTPDNCPQTMTDKRGSSKTTSRTYCRQCGSFIDETHDETTMQFHKERVAIGKRIEKAPRASQALRASMRRSLPVPGADHR